MMRICVNKILVVNFNHMIGFINKMEKIIQDGIVVIMDIMQVYNLITFKDPLKIWNKNFKMKVQIIRIINVKLNVLININILLVDSV